MQPVKKDIIKIETRHMFADINESAVGGGDSAAIRLFSLGHANSSVNFLTKSLKTAGAEDTLV